ncbi:uncharacterized protein PHALS_01573 [Plasmopara halstedii]|uniref:Uncharacterized protein n=1 Tax=Plasmopara halstedii TaxID=4781 RepID=A0A0P1AW77_PLAHL|nr:uncharacterized protein PHALS_01573 [Plasmopara halstedii]CEG45264.1 hypothetical protein PHALS_01573 [Plasmopara halstedii]|eukprot:XP_024581633.1 hypothetical protein PHALS_01573 [Plasmopara halstedii]
MSSSSSSSSDKSSSPDLSLFCDGSSTLRKIFYTVRFQSLLFINFVPVRASKTCTIRSRQTAVWKRQVARNVPNGSDWSCASAQMLQSD